MFSLIYNEVLVSAFTFGKKLEKDVFLLIDLKSTGKVITSKLSFSNKYYDLCI